MNGWGAEAFEAGVLVLVAAYALGSLSFAVIISRSMGLQDPRSYGSGNPGATNVLRSGSKAAAILTLAGDALKGVAGVLIGHAAARAFGLAPEIDMALAAAGGLAAFIGHLAPVFFGFRGGKGVATFLGAIAALNPLAGAVAGLTWLAAALLGRYASLASMLAAVAAAVAQCLLTGGLWPSLAVVVMTALLIWRHRANIDNLRAGRERRIGERASST